MQPLVIKISKSYLYTEPTDANRLDDPKRVFRKVNRYDPHICFVFVELRDVSPKLRRAILVCSVAGKEIVVLMN